MIECLHCHAQNSDTHRFCGSCGKPLVQAQAAAPDLAERRQLTVMFCDLVDSTALSHELDPEDLREVVRAYQRCATGVIERYDGFIARYMGDGIMAYFGYPRAHEDDAERAIHAALEVAEAVSGLRRIDAGADQHALSVRIGIATGLVVVGDLIGAGASEEAAVTGETPNLAARLEALAASGTVVVAQRTHDLAGAVFEYRDEGAHALKGFPEPVRAWTVLRPRELASRFDAAREARPTPFVGREREIDVLLSSWRRTREGGGQVVLLSGEAGIGKSRIIEHVCGRIAGDAPRRIVYQCSPYRVNSALYPFIRYVEHAAGFARGDSVDTRLAKLEALLAKPVPSSAETTALFAALLSLPTGDRYRLTMTPQQQKERTFAALIERLRVMASTVPLLITFEDVHWIDPTSLEYLDLAVRAVAELPVLAVVTTRTGAEYPWLELPHTTALQLDRLDAGDAAALVRGMSGDSALPARLVEEIVAKSDGVPLYVEELTKTTGASGTAAKAVPATLQDSLMARLDRLGPAKEIAQIGAVIGREFSRDLIAALSPLAPAGLDEALETLTRSAVLVTPAEPARSFVFRHALLQDAAYASLLRSRRQELHTRIAETLERNYPERVRIEPEVLAHHYTEASHAVRAARYWAAAAQRGLERWANPEAAAHAAKGLEVLSTAPSGEREPLEVALEILRGTAYRAIAGFASSEAERSFAHALKVATSLRDVPRSIDARRGLFACYYARGALSLAREQGREVAQLGVQLNAPAPRMLGQWMMGCVAFWQGEFAASRDALEEAHSLYDPHVQRANTLALQIDPGVNALLHLSWVRWVLGCPDQAIVTSDRAIETARSLSQPFAVAMALFWGCATRASCGHDEALRRLLDELEALAARHGLGYFASCARVLDAHHLISRGECAAAFEQIGRAFAEFRSQEAGVGIPWAISISANGYLRLGKTQEGLAAVAKALEAVERNGERHWEAELWRLRGELVLAAGDDAAARSSFVRAIEIAQAQSAKALELRAATSLARLYLRGGERARARAVLGPVLAWFSEGFDTADLREARATFGTLAPQ